MIAFLARLPAKCLSLFIRGNMKNREQEKRAATTPRKTSAFEKMRASAEDRLKDEIIFPSSIPAAKIRAEARRRLKAYRQIVKEKLAASKGKKEILLGDFLEALREDMKMLLPREKIPRRSARGLAPLLPRFDWRLACIVPSIRNQKKCGACWAFAATEAYESSLMKNQNKYKSVTLAEGESGEVRLTQIGISVQDVLDCASEEGDCAGGWPADAFEFFVTTGVPIAEVNDDGLTIDDRDFIGQKQFYKEPKGEVIQAIAWDYVHADPDKIPSVKTLKEALLEHGPLVVFVRLDKAFRKYPKGGEVFDEHNTDEVNHVVLLTGWDDEKEAWIIQNSFGTRWGIACIERSRFGHPLSIGSLLKLNRRKADTQGDFHVLHPSALAKLKREKGCMYIKWGSNQIGKHAMWIEAPFELGKLVPSAARKKKKSS